MNEYIAALVDELHRLGVRHAVFSPGSRSTTMALFFEEHGGFNTYMNIDERSAAFMALGIAKVHRMPAVLVCTSGSAAAHYLPAVVEAQYSGVPMIILSADRPPTLRHVGAPQTIDQQKLFGSAVNYYEELVVPQESHYYTYPRLVARKAFMKSMDIKRGPVHVNVPLFEPLVPDLDVKYFEQGRSEFSIVVPDTMMNDFTFPVDYSKRFLILAGPQIPMEERRYIFDLAARLGAPVLMDPLSNLRRLTKHVFAPSEDNPQVTVLQEYDEDGDTANGITAYGVRDYGISGYDTFLGNEALWSYLKPDCVIQFGQMMVSKRVQQMVGSWTDIEYIEVAPVMEYTNPMGNTTMHVQSSVRTFCWHFFDWNSEEEPDRTYLHQWLYLNKAGRERLNTVIHEPNCFEGRTIRELQKYMLPRGQIMVANSMSIRDFDAFWEPLRSDAFIYGNRGVNGIDGTVSTALGMATNDKPTVLVTGDLSFFHDLNGLAVAKTHELNLTIILHNNDGGGIFEYLPVKKTKHFNRLFQTEQGIDYAGAARMYGMGYVKLTHPDEFAKAFTDAIGRKGINIIEIPTDKKYSRELHRRYMGLDVTVQDIESALKNPDYDYHVADDEAFILKASDTGVTS